MIDHPNDTIKSCFLRAGPWWPAALMELTRTVRAVGFGRARLDHGPGEIQCLASVAFSPSEFYYLRKVPLHSEEDSMNMGERVGPGGLTLFKRRGSSRYLNHDGARRG